jgi:UDP:flavonoid glycosyltransferase YjiC (YdhE family)
MTTLGAALKRRGHRVSLAALPESRSKAEAAALEFLAIGEREHREGTWAADRERLGQLKGFAAMRFTGKMLCKAAATTLRDAPDVFRNAGIDGVLADQVSPAGSSVAEAIDVPLVMICNALALHQEPATPPPSST